MSDVGSLNASLTLKYANFSSGIKKATSLAKDLGSELNSAVSNGLDSANAQSQARILSSSISQILKSGDYGIKIDVDSSSLEAVTAQVSNALGAAKSGIKIGVDDSYFWEEFIKFLADVESETKTIAPPEIPIKISWNNLTSDLSMVETLIRTNTQMIAERNRIDLPITLNQDSLNASEINSAMGSIIDKALDLAVAIELCMGPQGFGRLQGAASDLWSVAGSMDQVVNKAEAFSRALSGMTESLRQAVEMEYYTSQLGNAFEPLAASCTAAVGSVMTLNEALERLLALLMEIFGEGLNFTAVEAMDEMAMAAQLSADSMRAAGREADKLSSSTKKADANTKKLAQNTKKVATNLQSGYKFADLVKRTIGGIIISQAFYQITNEIQKWIDMVNEFSMEMEQAAISFKYLLGDADEAGAFIEALQNFAISSPLDTAGAEKATRLLMTMGVSAENAIPVLRVLTDTAVVAGGEIEDTVYRISLALGQMLQSGTVKMQEIRQLVNANVPIFEILQEELGLTAEQVSQIGKQGVDSAKAVSAILAGLQKRFGGASLEMQNTMKGATNAIQDSFLVLGQILTKVPFEAVRDKLVQLSNVMTRLAQIGRELGAGGVFEAIVPPGLQAQLRNVIGAFGQLWIALKYLLAAAAELAKTGFWELIQVLNFVLPPITIFINALSQMTYAIIKSHPYLRLFLTTIWGLAILNKIWPIFIMFGKILTGPFRYAISVAIKALDALVNAIITMYAIWFGRWWKMALVVTVAVAAILVAIGHLTGFWKKAHDFIVKGLQSLSDKWAKLKKTLSGDLGYDPNKIAKPVNKDAESSAEKYEQELQAIENKLKDVEDQSKKTKKATAQNFLQSFDEVYQIKPKEDDDTDDDTGDDDLDFEWPEFPDLPELPEIEDLGDAIDNLFDIDITIDPEAIWAKLKEALQKVLDHILDWLPYALAAILGAAIAKALGLPLALGIAAGLLAQAIIDAIMEALGFDKHQKDMVHLAEIIGALIGAAIGYLVGGTLLSTALGGAIGMLVGAIWGILAQQFELVGSDVGIFSVPICAAIAGAIAKLALHLGPIGIACAAVAGAIVGFLIDAIYTGITTGDWTRLATPIAGSIGMALGFVLGGPLGAAIGGVIGLIVGEIFTKLQQKMVEMGVPQSGILATALNAVLEGAFAAVLAMLPIIVTTFINAAVNGVGPTVSALLSGGIKGFLTTGLKGGIIGAIAGLAGGTMSNLLNNWLAKEMNATEQDIQNGVTGQAIGGMVGSIAGAIIGSFTPLGPVIGSAIGNVLGQVIGGVIGLISSQASTGFQEFRAVVEEFGNNWRTFWWETFPQALYDVGYNLGGWFAEHILVPLGEAFGPIVAAVSEFVTTFQDTLALIVTGQFDWVGWLQGIVDGIRTWWEGTIQAIQQAWSDFWTGFFEFVRSLADIGQWIQLGMDLIQGLIDGIITMGESLIEAPLVFLQGFIDGIRDFFDTHSPSKVMMALGVDIIQGLINGVLEAMGTLLTQWGEAVATLLQNVLEWFGNIGTALVEWAGGIVSTLTDWVTNTVQAITDWASQTTETIAGWISDTMEKIVGWISDTQGKITDWAGTVKEKFTQWKENVLGVIDQWKENALTKISTWVQNTQTKIEGWSNTVKGKFTQWKTSVGTTISTWASTAYTNINTWLNNTRNGFNTWTGNVQSTFQGWGQALQGIMNGIFTAVEGRLAGFISSTMQSLSTWASNVAAKIQDVLSRAAEAASQVASKLAGHAQGGVFNREHIARVAEGGKAEAIIPLQEEQAMKPFVDAVAKGLTESLAPVLANGTGGGSGSGGGGSNLQPLYVGTLIADDRGLKELQRKMDIIQASENRRRS